MARVAAFVLISAATLIAGCQPDIQGFDPNPVKRGQMVKVEGIRMTGASMTIDGTPVGSAFVLASSDPMNRRDVIIPSNAGSTVNVGASDPTGSDSMTANVDAAPASSAAPPLNFSIAAVRNPISGAVTVTATGTGIFPGAGSGTGMFEGPAARLMPGAIAADRHKFMSDGEYYFRFNAVPAGTYKLEIQNASFYGGQAGLSNNTITP